MLDSGVKNFFDIQATHLFLCQLVEQLNNPEFQEQNNVRIPSLNDVLELYGVSHGKNDLKQKFKKIFSSIKTALPYFQERPLKPDFISYARQDVEDLLEVAEAIEDNLKESLAKINGVDIEFV